MPYEYKRRVNAGGSGAKEGLDKKMKYWADKDYQYEFGVTMGMAINLAVGTSLKSLDQIREDAKKIFNLALELKLDPDMRLSFDDYYNRKKHLGDEPVVEITKD